MGNEFDRVILRSGTSSLKYDGRMNFFGTSDVLPLWVADMDFATPAVVREALMERAAHPIYGYTVHPESLFEALMAWLKSRHAWQVNASGLFCAREWFLLCTQLSLR